MRDTLSSSILEMPPPSVWGPPLWKVLHGIGYMTAKGLPSLHKDSERECIWLVTHMEYIIPCRECIAHFFAYKQKNHIPKVYTNIGEWLCGLHNSVNEKLGKEVVSYSPEQESASDVRGDWLLYLESIKDSLRLGLVAGDKLREFSRHILLWQQYTLQ